MDIAAGRLVAERYRIVDRIGEGGMGIVYRATDEKLHRTIALKFLPAAALNDADRLGRFKNESRALTALNHPHIVTMYEVGEDAGTPFFVMELVDGQTLRSRIRSGRLPADEAIEIALQVARGLSAAHEKGLIHRDIKPDNVMIRRDGYVKILDFGIALLRAGDSPMTTALTMGSLETVAGGVIGTPAYMSPEQIDAGPVDARTDIFSLGLMLCEAVTGQNPYLRPTALQTIDAIRQTPATAEVALTALPPEIQPIVRKCLQRDAADRYSSMADVVAALRQAQGRTGSQTGAVPPAPRAKVGLVWWIAAAVTLVAVSAGATMLYRQSERRRWVHDTAVPQIGTLVDQNNAAQAFPILTEAEGILPGDPELVRLASRVTRVANITSTPAGAAVSVQDYASPDSAWLSIGTTPLEHIRIPRGYLRWKVSKAGVAESITAPFAADSQTFDLDLVARAPAGMVPVSGGVWLGILAFFGGLGPYTLPPFFIDRYEVTNRQYQAFVDAGGYATKSYWTQPFVDGSRTLAWPDAMDRFRDTTGRPGPATWTGGHFPEGKADVPVTGVSWYEAAAYAAFADRSLPVMAQGYKAEPVELDQFVLPFSNLATTVAPAGQFRGLGPFGTYDLIGNAREWYVNGDGTGLRYTLGRQPASYGPEALLPFDRSPLNGFRCVKNTAPVPDAATAPVPLLHRDFWKARPVDDEVFRVYRNMYAYERTPLEAAVDPNRQSTDDWTREKITFRTAYNNERMAAYLFLPKHARPPFQAVVFYPSARVFLSDSTELGDLSFVDYVVQSGRAVIYPVYEGLYERRTGAPTMPGSTVQRQQIVDWSKDVGRSIDYLATRTDIDSTRLGYLGVSQGSAYGVILAALEDRFRAVVFLDGGFFQFEHPIAGIDQVDFAPRLTKPTLMVNGRYDATFPYESAQLPMLRMIGAPAADKAHRVFETGHDVRLKHADLVREVLGWLDKYLGRVQ